MSKQSEDVVYIESGKRWAKIPAPSPTVEQGVMPESPDLYKTIQVGQYYANRIAAILIGLRRGDTSLPELIRQLEELV